MRAGKYMVENKGNEQHIKMFPMGISHFEPLPDLKSNVQHFYTVLLWDNLCCLISTNNFIFLKHVKFGGDFIFS